jgi:hypothetical protein
MTRILAVADEVDEGMYGERLPRLAPEVVVACGDLPFDYLEYLVSRLDVPLLYVPGNHDPDLHAPGRTWSALSPGVEDPGPPGCINADGRVIEVAGLRVAGLGGSVRYRPGPNQYSQSEMRRRALRLELKLRIRPARSGRRLDLLITHAAPEAVDRPDTDPAHRGFKAFHRLVRNTSPRAHVYGHVHPYGLAQPVRKDGVTLLVNAVPYRVFDV